MPIGHSFSVGFHYCNLWWPTISYLFCHHSQLWSSLLKFRVIGWPSHLLLRQLVDLDVGLPRLLGHTELLHHRCSQGFPSTCLREEENSIILSFFLKTTTHLLTTSPAVHPKYARSWARSSSNQHFLQLWNVFFSFNLKSCLTILVLKKKQIWLIAAKDSYFRSAN